jgi:phenylpropionate dioxygenase-like ring-hydroxylating dioxygenase large terminal subunit
MDLLGDPIWQQFWYAVGFSEDLGDLPLSRTVLGQPIVLWRDQTGVPAAAIDRCPHREGRLSQGWTCDGRIVCPYHGWEYGPDGSAVRIPQTPALSEFPPRFALRHVEACERYGVVWICLGSPVRDVPALPEATTPGWRFVREFDEEWAAHPARLMENSFDPAHTVFVHRATFGDTQRPDVAVPTVERTCYGLVIRSALSVANPDFARATTGESSAYTTRASETQFHAPFLRVLRSKYPAGIVHQIVTAATPVDDDRLRLVQWAVRNDSEEDAPAADVVAFDRRVTWEDQAILEGIAAPYSYQLTANVHIAVDRPTIEIRRIYSEIATRAWAGLSADMAASSVTAGGTSAGGPGPAVLPLMGKDHSRHAL